MSLKAAVLDIVKDMEADLSGPGVGTDAKNFLTLYVRLLKVACAAAPDATPYLLGTPDDMVQRARAEAAVQRQKAAVQEQQGEVQRELVDPGQDVDGDLVTLPGNVPEGAYLPVAGRVYQLRAGRLYFSEEQTRRWASAQRKGGGE